MCEAASAWKDSLSPQQRTIGCRAAPGDADAEADRLAWYYTPTDHGGLTFHQQSPAQQSLAMQLVSTGLSVAGLATVATIMGTENVLDRIEGFRAFWGRERGRDPALFYLRVFGEPGVHGAWAWRFAGHHVSLSLTIVGGRVVATTPSFLGCDPAFVRLLGGGVLRPLGGPEDRARALLHALQDRQRRIALLSDRAVSDIVSGNRVRISDGDQMMHMQDLWNGEFDDPALRRTVDETDAAAERASGYGSAEHAALALTAHPKGLSAADMSAAQRDRLRGLIDAFHDRLPAELASEPRLRYQGEQALDEVAFAWAGGPRRGEPHYFRVQGPGLLIEYDNTQRDANHAHSVLRNPTTDFGLDAVADHLRGGQLR